MPKDSKKKNDMIQPLSGRRADYIKSDQFFERQKSISDLDGRGMNRNDLAYDE